MRFLTAQFLIVEGRRGPGIFFLDPPLNPFHSIAPNAFSGLFCGKLKKCRPLGAPS